MQNIRTLKMPDALCEILRPLCEGKDENDLVFTSANGTGCIDDALLLKSVFTPVCQCLGIPRRVLYVARKSMATRAIQQGYAVDVVAYLLGHATIFTAMKHYIEVQKTEQEVPGFLEQKKADKAVKKKRINTLVLM
jgi:integrase